MSLEQGQLRDPRCWPNARCLIRQETFGNGQDAPLTDFPVGMYAPEGQTQSGSPKHMMPWSSAHASAALLEPQSAVRMAYGCFWPLLSPAAAGVFPTGNPCSW
jgi:hypothetical protein